MDAVAAGGGVEEDAGEGVGMVEELDAGVFRDVVCGVVAGKDYGKTFGLEGGLEALGEGEGDVFFEGFVWEGGA